MHERPTSVSVLILVISKNTHEKWNSEVYALVDHEGPEDLAIDYMKLSIRRYVSAPYTLKHRRASWVPRSSRLARSKLPITWVTILLRGTVHEVKVRKHVLFTPSQALISWPK